MWRVVVAGELMRDRTKRRHKDGWRARSMRAKSPNADGERRGWSAVPHHLGLRDAHRAAPGGTLMA